MHQQMLHLVATLLIVYELSLTTVSSRYVMAVADDATSSVATSLSLSLKGTEMDVNSFTHINKPSVMTAMVNRLPRHTTVQGLRQQQLKEQQHSQQIKDPSSLESLKIKRSFSTGAGWASTSFNGLAAHMGTSQQQNIRSSGSGSSYDAAHQPTNQQYQQYTEAKPIYEEQQENDYAGGAGGSGPSYGQHSSTGVANAPALHSAIYNLQTAGTHNAAVGTSSNSNGGSDGFLPSWNFGKLSTSFIASQAASTPYPSSGSGSYSSSSGNSNDKISEGNFLHHYDSASAFNEYTPQHEYQPYQQQLQLQQQQLQQKHENFYNSVEHTEADTSSSSYGDEHEHEHSGNSHFSNYQQHEFEQQHQQEKQPDVINYVPYPVVKKQHVPVREPVQIPVSHAVIIPVSKPVPIHIPVTQNVQVPVEQELKIPVERVVPYPVEKHVPVPVEKRVPYPVVKYVPVKIPRPFPVKVPVFKTVLHKVKGWW